MKSDASVFCAIRPEGDRRAYTGGHPPGNAHRAAMPRAERGIAVSREGKGRNLSLSHRKEKINCNLVPFFVDFIVYCLYVKE